MNPLLQRARIALRTGAVAEALQDLESVYDQAVARKDRALEAEALVEIARGLRARGTIDQAVLAVSQATEAARSGGLVAIEAEAYVVESELLRHLGNGEPARARLQQAAKLLDSAQMAARSSGALAEALDLADRARAVRDLLLQTAAAPAGSGSAADRAASVGAARRDESHQKRQQALMEKLYDASQRLVAERDPRKVVAAILSSAIEATGAERGFVLLTPDAADGADAEDETRELPGGFRVAAARNFDRAEVRKPEFKVSRSVIERALSTKKPALVHDAGLDAELSKHSSIQQNRLKSVVCVPFESPRANVRGALYLDNRFGEGVFQTNDLPALAAFAAHAAVALESARLYARSEAERRAVEAAKAHAEDLARRLEAELSKTGDELGKVRARLDDTQRALAGRSGFGGIVGSSHALQEVYRILEKVKDADVPVLIRGESGTGKELVARAIHFESARKAEPFVSENAAAIPETLLESALFGHEPGSFTGAVGRREGIFELAGAGTLFLDEVGELTLACQAKLLRVLEDRKFRRVGGADEIPVHARVICATHRDLEAMVKEGTFRGDLFYRLNVVSIRLPALRERRDDIPLLLEKLFARATGSRPEIAPDALRALLAHDWPGNVRELDNEVRRLLALKGDRIALDDLSPEVRKGSRRELPAATPDEAPLTLEEGERRVILAALKAARGNKARAAEILAIPRGTLYHKLKDHKID